MANPILLTKITDPDKAAALFVDRRSAEQASSTLFYEGDHWQSSKGWIGAAPTDGDSSILSQIESGFVSENVIGEVIDRHVAGVLGREPLWGFIPEEMAAVSTESRRRRFAKRVGLPSSSPTKATAADAPTAQEADDALTVWWNKRRPREQLKDALRIALAEGQAVLRFFVPAGIRDEQGTIPLQSDLTNALDFIHIDVLKADKAGVFVDSDTQEEFGVYIYQNSDDKQVAEITFIDNGMTVLEVLVKDEAPQRTEFDLGGRLLLYEVKRKAMITEQVKSNQRSLNLALTMMMRNVNLAGSLERTVLNAERPKQVVRIADATQVAGYREELREGNYLTGAGSTMFLTGLLIRNDQGEIIGRANPNISFRDPVKIETFTGTRDQFYAAILGQCQQKHALISGDATVSGRSREQARGEYEGSLKDSADVVDDAGRWMLETPLRLGAQFCNQSKKFAGLRNDFTSIIETGPVAADERTANRDDVAAKLMSVETAMSRNGIDDTDAELQRIEEEAPAEPVQPTLNADPSIPPNQEANPKMVA